MSRVFTLDELDQLAKPPKPETFSLDELDKLATAPSPAIPPTTTPKPPAPTISRYESIKLGPVSLGDVIGGVSKAVETVQAPARKFQESLAKESGQPGRISPTRKAAYVVEETVNEAVRQTAGLVGGFLLDPLNLPFLLAGGPEVRPAIRLGADALMGAMQQVQAVQAFKDVEWNDPSTWTEAAKTQAFALLGWAGAASHLKKRIVDAAKPETRTPEAVNKDIAAVTEKPTVEIKPPEVTTPKEFTPAELEELAGPTKPKPVEPEPVAPEQPPLEVSPVAKEAPIAAPEAPPVVESAPKPAPVIPAEKPVEAAQPPLLIQEGAMPEIETKPKAPRKPPAPLPEPKPSTPREEFIWNGAQTEMENWAADVRNAQEQLKRGESAMTMESNVEGKLLEEEATKKASSIRSLAVKEGSPLEKFEETPQQLAEAIEDRGGRLKDSKKMKLYRAIQEAYRQAYETAHGESIDAHLEREAKAAELAPAEQPTIESIHRELAEMQQASKTRALSEIAAGRRPELLKEGKVFDEQALVESELFGGRGGPQQFLGTDERAAIQKETEGSIDFDFGGEPRRGPRPTLPSATVATVTQGVIAKSQILRDLSKKLDIPLRVGRFRQQALGIFKVKPEVARTRIANDLAVASHEFGHAINKIMYGTGGTNVNLNWKPFQPFRAELEAIATKPRAGQSPLPEGFAEYIRMRLTDPAQAAQKVPQFDAFFNTELARFPELQGTLDTAQKDIARYINQPAVAKVLSAISIDAPPATRNRFNEFYTNMVDKLEPVRQAVEAMGGAPTDQNAYKAARLFAGWAGKADRFLRSDTFDAKTLKSTGQSLKAILRPVEENLDNFRAYLVARRVIEKSAQGIETGIDISDAKATVQQLGTPVFEKAAKDLYAYNGALLDYLESRQMLSPEQKAAIQKLNQDYVPFYRAFETEAATSAGKKAGTEFGNVGAAIHRMVGSGRDIVDPLESTVKNTYALINLAERNEVARILVDQAKEVSGAGKFVERIPQKIEPVTFRLEEIKKSLEDAGVDVEMADLKAMATVFKRGHEQGGRDNIMSVVRNGQREYYTVEPTLYRALQGLDDAGSHVLIRLLSVPAQLLRVGATSLSPEFLLRNPARDAFTAFMQSEYGFRPGIDTVRGVFHALKQDDLYWEWKSSGAEHAAMASLDRTELQRELKDLMGSPVKYVARHPLEALKMLSEFGESGTRIGEYARAKAKGATTQEAALASRNVSVDFARHGASTRALNSVVAFWNANVQGMDQFARLHKQFPLRSAVRGLAGLTLPSLILYSVNKDNDKYKELPRWRKDLFWNFPTDGTPLAQYTPFVMIPKPFEWGMIYASVPERIAEWAETKKPEAFDSLANDLFQVALPGVVPTAAIPPIEAWANKSLFTGAPIIPGHLQRLEPEFQYEYWTSEFAKAAARTLKGVQSKTGIDVRVSPMQIDNAVFGYSGGFGRLVADMTNPLLRSVSGAPAPPSRQAADYPLIRGFAMRYPGGTTESSQKFYNLLNDLQRKRSTETADRKGRLTGATPMTPAENRNYGILNSTNGYIQGQRQRQRMIVASDAAPAEKRRQIDAIELLIRERMKRALAQVR